MSFDGKGTWSRIDVEKLPGAVQSAYDIEASSVQTFRDALLAAQVTDHRELLGAVS